MQAGLNSLPVLHVYPEKASTELEKGARYDCAFERSCISAWERDTKNCVPDQAQSAQPYMPYSLYS